MRNKITQAQLDALVEKAVGVLKIELEKTPTKQDIILAQKKSKEDHLEFMQKLQKLETLQTKRGELLKEVVALTKEVRAMSEQKPFSKGVSGIYVQPENGFTLSAIDKIKDVVVDHTLFKMGKKATINYELSRFIGREAKFIPTKKKELFDVYAELLTIVRAEVKNNKHKYLSP